MSRSFLAGDPGLLEAVAARAPAKGRGLEGSASRAGPSAQ